MADSCCSAVSGGETALNDPRWRRVLWFALVVNAVMFAVEMAAGSVAESRALQADALDFLGDAANYAISLLVAGMALSWRSCAAFLKGASILVFGLWVLCISVYAAFTGANPEPQTMGVIGSAALVANVGVALMLYRYRAGDANMRSAWICSRNDAIGNIAVMLAAIGVFQTGSPAPDLAVAGMLAALAISGGWQIVRQARGELRAVRLSSTFVGRL